MDNAAIMPFEGWRLSGSAEELARRTYVAASPWAHAPDDVPDGHVLRLLEPAFRDDDPATSARVVRAWSASGRLVPLRGPALWAYQIDEAGRTALGLAALIDLDSGLLRPHEEVIERYVEVQSALAATTHGHWEPLTAFRPGLRVATLVAPRIAGVEPDLVVRSGTRTDRLWAITEPEVVDTICATLGRAPLTIADGHHRYAAWRALPAGAARHALTLVLDPDAIQVGAIHRVVNGTGLDDLVDELAPDQLAPIAGTEPDVAAFLESGATHVVLSDGRRHLGAALPPCATRRIDAAARTLADPRSIEPVGFEPDLARALAAAGSKSTAALVGRPDLDSIDRAASTGEVLAHKSSSFAPKPRVGLLMHRWD
ncbi:uncharacterized protein (DUF1015 family) [Mumia flava]|uniref:Uncharacterized protein (DUF1015 family) n=1 Tax=Mumia flava TaxID=1348852 RepID=A0A0B2B826_9ACTN|nr:DUF1015 family protein [Mumia flava]PJJ53358.1 uncharacterized protein (DUF1015 family) [Mumia flava]